MYKRTIYFFDNRYYITKQWSFTWFLQKWQSDQIEILNKNFLQNEAQYDLDRKAAIISARSSKNLDKVEYLTGEDLGLKPNTIEQWTS